MGINAGVQEYQVRLERIEKARQVRLQNVKVRAVFHAVRQAKVEIARNLAHGIILFGMHGKGEKIRIIGQAIRRSVALMDIEINDERPLDPARPPKRLCGNRHIVEDTEPGPGEALAVMAAARGAAGKTVLKGKSCG